MKLVDANVLLYVVNRDTVHHTRVLEWWERALDDTAPIGISWIVALAFLRVSTNPRAFAQPLTVAEAMDILTQWFGHPNIRHVSENEMHWSLLKELLSEVGTGGNLTTDAHLATLAIAHGAILVSCDNDFTRFPKLRWLNPLE